MEEGGEVKKGRGSETAGGRGNLESVSHKKGDPSQGGEDDP